MLAQRLKKRACPFPPQPLLLSEQLVGGRRSRMGRGLPASQHRGLLGAGLPLAESCCEFKMEIASFCPTFHCLFPARFTFVCLIAGFCVIFPFSILHFFCLFDAAFITVPHICATSYQRGGGQTPIFKPISRLLGAIADHRSIIRGLVAFSSSASAAGYETFRNSCGCGCGCEKFPVFLYFTYALLAFGRFVRWVSRPIRLIIMVSISAHCYFSVLFFKFAGEPVANAIHSWDWDWDWVDTHCLAKLAALLAARAGLATWSGEESAS